MAEPIFSAYITNLGKYNEGALVGEWVPFPTSYEELQVVFGRIGIGPEYEEWFITDYDISVDGIYEHLGEYESLDELNYFASRLEEMDTGEREKFEAVLMMGDCTSAQDFINLTDNLDSYDFISGVENEYDLGHYWLEESGAYNTEDFGFIAQYIDYEAYGRDISLNEASAFTPAGYVSTNGASLEKSYNGTREDIPEEYLVTVDPDADLDLEQPAEEKPSIAAMLAAARQAPPTPHKAPEASEPER